MTVFSPLTVVFPSTAQTAYRRLQNYASRAEHKNAGSASLRSACRSACGTEGRLAPSLHRVLRLKSPETETSVSELINEAVRQLLREDEEDLSAFEDRSAEPTLSYEAVLKDLKKHGKL